MKPTVKREVAVTFQHKEGRSIHLDVWSDDAKADAEQYGQVLWFQNGVTGVMQVNANFDFDEVLLYFLNYDKPVTTWRE